MTAEGSKTDGRFVVRGRVLYVDGTPVRDVLVRAFDRDLRNEEWLGEVATNAEGYYEIRYGTDRFRRAEKDWADLLVRVYDRQQQLLYGTEAADVLFNAPAEAVIDVRLPKATPRVESEYERLLKDVPPLLEGVAIEDLEESVRYRDMTFLSGETGWSVDRLEHLVVAHRLGRASHMEPAFFYALLRLDALLMLELMPSVRVRFAVDLDTEIRPLLYDVALLDEKVVRNTVSAAIAQGIVPRELEAALPAILQGLSRFKADAGAYYREEQPRRIFRLIERNVVAGKHEEVLRILREGTKGDIGILVDKLSGVSLITDDPGGDDARTDVLLGEVLGFDDALIESVRDVAAIKEPEDVRRLAKLNPRGWADLLVKARAGPGPGSKPLPPERAALHGSALARKMEARFPTTAFASQLERDTQSAVPEARAMAAVLNAHPDLDLRSTNVHTLLRSGKISWAPGLDPGQGAEALKAVQRVFKVAATYKKTNAVLGANLRSAAAIQAMGETRFVDRFGGTDAFTAAEARATYRKAAHVHLASTFLAAELKATLSASDPVALKASTGDAASLLSPSAAPSLPKKLEAVSKDFPNLKSLFQTTDVCACEECNEIGGANHYVADVLQFLKNRLVIDTTSTSSASLKIAKDVLFARRPDIGDLDLSCPNKNVLVRYVDLACEVMEDAVAPDPGIAFGAPVTKGLVTAPLLAVLQAGGLPFTDKAAVYEPDLAGSFVVRDERAVCKITPDGSGGWTIRRLRQTYASEAELAAAPEYVNEAAYVQLQTARYALRLPFDLFHQEARGYLEQFDVPRASLMRALQVGTTPSDRDVAAEQLGLSDEERTLIAVAEPGQQAAYWNTTPQPAEVALKVVDAFLTKTDLSFAELLELLRLPFIDPAGTIFVRDLDSSCDTAQKEIVNLDAPALDRLHRFLRLRRATAWASVDLDRAIRAPRLGAGTLDDACLVRVADLQRLQARLGLAVGELCTFFGELPHDGPTSRYQQVFLNPAADGSVDDGLKPEAVRANETAAPSTQKTLVSFRASLALRLNLKPADLDLLLGQLPPNAILSFENLSALYSMSLLARTLKLSCAELVALEGLTGTKPLDSPAETLRFVQQADRTRSAGTPPLDLRYLLRHEATDLEARAFTDQAVLDIVAALQEGHERAQKENASPYDKNKSQDENLAKVRELLAKLPAAAPLSEAELMGFEAIVHDSFASVAGTFSNPPPTATAFIDDRLGKLLDTTAIKAKQAALAAAGTDSAREQLIESLLAALSSFFQARATRTELLTQLVKAMKATEPRVVVLLEKARLGVTGTPLPLLEILTSETLVGPPLPPPNDATLEPQRRAVRLLQKMVQFLAPSRLSDAQVGWLLEHSHDLGWLELDLLPHATGGTPVTFADWERFEEGRALLEAYPPVVNPDDAQRPLSFTESVFEAALTSSAASAVLGPLARLTGWDATVLNDLDGHFGFSVPDLAAYRRPATYRKLEAASKLLRRLGMDVAGGLAIVKAKLTAGEALALRQALKARYPDAQWLEVLKGIQDKLREKKRDALAAYLLAVNPSLKSTNDLFDYFLIDVLMCACQVTSRTAQIHAALQLYVQRCLMGQEATSVADVKKDSGWKQWKWMKEYRVWQANLKVFLFPESYYLPGQFLDASAPFKDAKNALQQDELNELTIEGATVGYLERLDEVAFLEVVAVHYQVNAYVMHVFARTKGGDPPVYFHRRFEKERYWSRWEKIELDVTGDHFLAFVRNSRLCLAWPVFTKAGEPEPTSKMPDTTAGAAVPNEKPKKKWQIQLAIAEYAGNKWLPKKTSKEAIEYPSVWVIEDELPKLEDFRFVVLDMGASGYHVACTNVTAHVGTFALSGCKGYPEPVPGSKIPFNFWPRFKDAQLKSLRYRESSDATDDLAVKDALSPASFQGILGLTPGTPGTPGIFKITHPHQLTVIDFLLFLMQPLPKAVNPRGIDRRNLPNVPLGTFMPYFYEDGARGYVVRPGFFARVETHGGVKLIQKTFSDIHKLVTDVLALLTEYLRRLQADPAHDLPKLLADLVRDPEYIRILQEIQSYQKLRYGLQFKNFYHPLACFLRTVLYRDGVPGLMRHETQMTNTGFDFPATYQPDPIVVQPYPVEALDFDPDASYRGYDWEWAFHLPFTIADRLTQNHRFELALQKFHEIFDPTGGAGGAAPQKYWVTKPFYLTSTPDYVAQRIDSILYRVAADPSGASIGDHAFAIAEWRDKPFQPDVIARSRPVTYQKAVVMKYIECLLAYGDDHLRRYTRESVTQATQLYVLADKLMGPKPRIVPPTVKPPIHTYNQLEAKLDLLSNALLDLENLVPDPSVLPEGGAELPPSPMGLTSLYFCIPLNEKMLGYWDKVADRLFKIRHCQNIDGVEAPLALFAPPIDPSVLVAAVASGLDISEVMSGLNAPLPFYRFDVMAQKATELAQIVASLGSALLQSLEKKDAEALARLRSEQEIRILDAVKAVKAQQLAEARTQIEVLDKSLELAREKATYYRSRDFMNAAEIVSFALTTGSLISQAVAMILDLTSGGTHLIPDISVGVAGIGGSPMVVTQIGGRQAGSSVAGFARGASALAGILQTGAGMSATIGTFQRRQEEWEFQATLADRELAQLEKQKKAADLRKTIAELEVKNHDRQTENSRQMDTFMRSKYTNQELYDWMTGQISSIYFPAYQLALDMAKKAERCFRHELGTDGTFIQSGYWASLRKGLLSAEPLLHDIKRMEASYLDQNRREYELTKHISLAQLNPLALIQLKTKGDCTFEVPEALFDMDHPGHYMRRLGRFVSLSIPCVAGAYTPVTCKLTLVSNKYRRKTEPKAGAATDRDKYEEDPSGDSRFAYDVLPVQSIATSQSIADSGTFERNQGDPQYSAFQRAGAISRWKLEMPTAFPQFDRRTISDVILHLPYTARDGGMALKTLVEGIQRERLNDLRVSASETGLLHSVNLRHQLSTEWQRLKQDGTVSLTVRSDLLPYFTQGHGAHVESATWIARGAIPQLTVDGKPVASAPYLGTLHKGVSDPIAFDTPFTLKAANAADIGDVVLVLKYTLTS